MMTGRFAVVVLLLPLLIACPGMLPYGTKLECVLTPALPESDSTYVLESDGSVALNLDGLKITVRPMRDEELNKLFPEVSYRGEASTNPYTYGNWVDPELGFTPQRFTVFLVRLYNYTKPKVNLNPWQAVLLTDRGDELHSYGRDAKDPAVKNFYDYYKRITGASGVEQRRFEERMGLVRQTLYVDGPVFKGDKKEGYLVFDPLDPEVREVTLVFRGFVLQYDANNWPAKTTDLSFRFKNELVRVSQNRSQ